ncbi:GH1 family beta-glucosidase [Streptomyces sp. NPDC001046]|uniref:GH1 family beta-glucosidase n=1 Tax=Streptomyces sp. NPDC001046 TaxID=3364543 RepID=UPI00368721F7
MNSTTAPTATAAEPDPGLAHLPADFLWGVATSSYQIEGAASEDGRTPSIWDTFCRVPGAVVGQHNGDVACDHYRRMPEDVAMIAGLGVNAYRFSIAWPRVQPHGRGPANARGLDFYKRLVDELLARGVQPWITLYHWDLPQELEDMGGWPARDTAYRFADYAALVQTALGDRVEHWTTLNEPWCSAYLGYAEGMHAPGRREPAAAAAATHHLLLGHGLVAQQLRDRATTPLKVGITLNLSDHLAASDDPGDLDALRRADGIANRLYLDPLLRGAYPADVVADLERQGIKLPVRDGDLEQIAQPLDTLGVNYYSHNTYAADPRADEGGGYGAGIRTVPQGAERTAMGWEVLPEGLTRLLVRLGRDYPGTPLVITENGAAYDDEVAPDGQVHDPLRVEYFRSHIAAVCRAAEQGADIRGYFAWSLMDNFEWAEGYRRRFGLVHVDYATQRRTLKDSAQWYSRLVERFSR